MFLCLCVAFFLILGMLHYLLNLLLLLIHVIHGTVLLSRYLSFLICFHIEP